VLHNNAAAKNRDLHDFFAPFEEVSLAAWREVMAVNIDGMFLVAQAVGRLMVEQGVGGSIIQTASTYGVVGPDQRIYDGRTYDGRKMSSPAVYSTSKAAVIGLTRYLATYWAPQRIRVNSLTPGGIDDEASKVDAAFGAIYSSRVPLGRMAAADDMVGAVVYLASDAASYVTGHNLVVDGGWTTW
jgi:NAD(P)-dependent dehydrogenase (short-subunit alcohol dehydrogenase family)